MIRNSNAVSSLVFISTVSMAILTTIAAIFPAFFLVNFGGRDNPLGVDPFEPGLWGLPIIFTNAIFFTIIFLYNKNKIPNSILKTIKKFFDFEISRNTAFFIMIILIGTYIIFSVPELFDDKFYQDYSERVKRWLENFDPYEIGEGGITTHVHVMMGVFSIQIFDNVKVIPFLASISLIIVTYFLTKELSGKRFSGIIASSILLQSVVFLVYDTSISYPNFWILFYLLSLLLILKLWYLSPISWLLGFLTKILTGAFIPFTFFFVYRADISRRRKIQVLSSYAIILIAGIISLYILEIPLFSFGPESEFDSHDFLGSLSSIAYSLRFDGFVLLFLIPLIVSLFWRAKKGNLQADSINFLILGIILITALVPSFGLAINVPYILIPLIVFFAIGFGMVISSKKHIIIQSD